MSTECSHSSLENPKEVLSILASFDGHLDSQPLLDTEMAIVSNSFGRQSLQYL